MSKKRPGRQFQHQVATKLSDQDSLHQYESAFRRWLARELAERRVTVRQASDQYKIPFEVIRQIRKRYGPQVVILEDMTDAEKHQFEELQKRLKLLEKQLEDARIKNIALETLVDVAEKEFKIPIRKKPGAKQ